MQSAFNYLLPMKTTTMKNDINQVCYRCGVTANILTSLKKYKTRPHVLSHQMSTYHLGICDVCDSVVAVTEPRDFFSPDFSLLQKNWILKLKK